MAVSLRSSSPAGSSGMPPESRSMSTTPRPVPSQFLPQFSEHHRRIGDLRILVPESDPPSLPGLADAIVMHPSSLASLISLYDMEKITQLPTPVVNNGSFHNYQLEVQKRTQTLLAAAAGIQSQAAAASRVVSDFRPAVVARSPTDSVDIKSRHILNPALLPARGAREIPLPPLDADPDFLGTAYLAPRLGVSYVFDHVVGTGAFSTVVRAHATGATPETVAVKIVTVPTDDASSVSNFRLYICRELGILMHVRHPVIVKLLDYNVTLSITENDILDVFSDEPQTPLPGQPMYDLYNMKVCNKQYFFLNYSAGGNLLQYLLRHHRIGMRLHAFWRLMERVVAELVVGVAFLHTNLVVHRDIKLENILLNAQFSLGVSDDENRSAGLDSMLVDPDFQDLSNTSEHAYGDSVSFSTQAACTLTDFGLLKKLTLASQLLLTKCGSQDYVSPELLMGLKYDGMLLDSWSLGVVIYSILEDRLPFDRPPQEYSSSLGVSPSVLKRRRSRHNPAHRIAMIDWEWFRAAAAMKNNTIPKEVTEIMARLMALVGVLLVRKDRRMLVAQVLADGRFAWIRECVPQSFCEGL